MNENSGFYDEISAFYDEMINYDDLVLKREQDLKSHIKEGVHKAADVGCGTGVDSIALYRLGMEVHSFDPSTGMLEKAKANAQRLGAGVKFYNYPAGNIPGEFNNTFDLVVSLGNTFANIDTLNFPLALKNIFSMLKPGGRMMIQVLNFYRILSTKERIVNISRKQEKYFVRFYDFHPDKIIFNVLTFNGSSPAERSLTSASLYPYTVNDFKTVFVDYKNVAVNYYSSINMQPFEPETSKDLFVVLEKKITPSL